MNTGTLRLIQLVVPADSGDPLASSPHNGYWQYVFWEDATHLLAWYNGTIGKTSSTAGLYRYDLTKNSLTQVVPLSSLGLATLFNAQKNAPLLLLDEATSALDGESEEAIREALGRLMPGRTVIAIAHRLSTVRHFDRIVVLQGGRIVQDGAPDHLLRREGFYRTLVRQEMGRLSKRAA